MNTAFPPIELNEVEEQEVIIHLSNPAVVKYFKALAHKTAVQILQMYSADNSTDKFLRDVASMQGQIVLLDTLLQITGE